MSLMWFFKSKHKRHREIIRAILIGTAVVLFWRGAWGLLDLYLLPHNPVVSFLSSLLAGILILFVTHKITEELM